MSGSFAPGPDLIPDPSPARLRRVRCAQRGEPPGGSIAAAARLAGLTALCAALLAGSGEAVLRAPAVQAALPAPNVGSSYEDGAKQVRLGWLDAVQPVDCLIVGSSVVVQGIEPTALEGALREAGGPPLRCFNAGIRGSVIADIEQQTEKLIRQHHPRLLVYAATYRDLLIDPGNPGPSLEEVNAARGVFSLPEWLADHSYLYRYYSTFRWFMRANKTALDNRIAYEARIDARGFLHETGVWPYIDRKPYPRVRYLTGPVPLDALSRLAGLRDDRLAVVMVEMPLPPTSVHLLAGAEKDYAAFLGDVTHAADQQHTPFIRTWGLGIIPDGGWADPVHLNENGARAFSRWLGRALAGVIAP